MKKLFGVAMAILFGLNSLGQVKTFRDLIGRWQIVDEQNPGYELEIIDSSTLFLTYMGEKKKILDYTIDFSRSPCWFDFSIKDSVTVLTIKSIMEMTPDSLLKWQVFVEEERPAQFTADKGETFYLKRSTINPAAASIANKKQ